MKGSNTRIIVAAIAATAALSAIGTTGVASAAMVGSRVATTTRAAGVQTASVRSRPTGSVPVPVATGSVSAARIEGGSTGDGGFDEKTCEALGAKAEEYSQKGFNEIANDGDLVAGQADGAAAQAVVDYGMDNGCFFSGLPW